MGTPEEEAAARTKVRRILRSAEVMRDEIQYVRVNLDKRAEAMLDAYEAAGRDVPKEMAKASMDMYAAMTAFTASLDMVIMQREYELDRLSGKEG
jgi:hypothetical protein